MAIPLNRSWDEQRRMLTEPYESQLHQYYQHELRKYQSMAEAEYSQRRMVEDQLARQAHEQKESRMQEQLRQWQDAVGKIAEVEALLASLIANEINWAVPRNQGAALNWPGRLDAIIGELSRYRDTLGRRVADGLMPRLIGTTNDNASNASA